MDPTLPAFHYTRDAEPSIANPAALVGSQLGDRYRLLELIGEGGIGCVFRAEQLTTRRIVALKLLRPEFAEIPQIAQRFAREAQVTARLAHPNIVEVVEFGESNGRLFLAMELLSGRSLASAIESKQGPLTIERTIAIMRQVLHALEHAHSHGVVHRDLKPENIMLRPARGLFSRERVKLLDFGIAKLDDAAAAAQKLTQAGLALGTPRYMSPEQAMGHETDARTDIYSCGVILYEMLTGRAPFEAESTPEVLSMHMTVAPRSLRAAAPEARIPAALDDVVLRALAKKPAERFPSARELCDALEESVKAGSRDADISGLEATILAVAPSQGRSAPRWLRVLRLGIALLGAVLLIADHYPAKRQYGAPVAAAPRASEQRLRQTDSRLDAKKAKTAKASRASKVP